MVECYFQQGSNSTLSKKQCATNEACHLTYIIHIDNVNINDSYNIKAWVKNRSFSFSNI